MFESICSLPLPDDLFTQATSPREPLLAVGLASGHVHCYKLPPISEDNDSNTTNSADGRRSSLASDNGYGYVDIAWKTRRHKGSCRSIAFSPDGEQLFSAGSDGLVKAAKAESGVVEWKIRVPDSQKKGGEGELDAPCLIHALSPQTLLVATDSAALHLYDIRTPTSTTTNKTALRPQATHKPHQDYISSLTPLPASKESTSGFPKQWITTGGTTLAVTDLRRGILAQSEDQEEELLSSAFISGLSKKGTSVGEKVIVGGAGGVLTLWERGVWDDQDERIVVDKQPGGGDSIDCIVRVPDGVGKNTQGRTLVCGMGNGLLAFVKLGQNKVIDVLKHDEVEGAVALDFDVGGRMISGGGGIVKVWREIDERLVKENAEEDEEEVEDEEVNGGSLKRTADSDDSDSDADSSEEEKEQKKRRKRKKKTKGIAAAQGPRKTGLSFSGID